MQTNLIKQCDFIHLSLRSLLQGENTASIDESRKQSIRMSFITPWIWHSPFHYLVRIRHRLLFEFQQKTTKNCIYIAHGEEYLPTFSLRLDTLHLRSAKFVLLEVFWFWFSLPRLASPSSDNVGNLSFSLLSLKRWREMENFGNLPDYIPPLSNNNATRELTQCFVLIG